MGSMDRYFIRFADGKSEWVGCDAMGNDLKGNSREVASVAFGENWDSYAIVFKDGGWSYSGVPFGISDLIRRRQSKCDLKCISLGPNGEYYVSAKNGRAWWGGMTEENLETIRKHYKDRMKFLDFCDDNQYIIRFS